MVDSVKGRLQSLNGKLGTTVALASVSAFLAASGIANANDVIGRQDSGFVVSIDPYLQRGEFAHQFASDDEVTRGLDLTIRNVRGDGWIEAGFGFAANEKDIWNNINDDSGSGSFDSGSFDFDSSVTDLGIGAGYRWDDFEVRAAAIMRQRDFEGEGDYFGEDSSSGDAAIDFSADLLADQSGEFLTGGDSYIFELEGTRYFGDFSVSANWAYEDFEGGDLSGVDASSMDSVQSLGARLDYLVNDEFVVGVQATRYSVGRSAMADVDYTRAGVFAAWQPAPNLAFRMNYTTGAEDSRDEFNTSGGFDDRSDSSLVFGLVWSFGSAQKPVWQAAQGSFLNTHRDLGVSIAD